MASKEASKMARKEARKETVGNWFPMGFVIAPASGMLLFVSAFLFVHYVQFAGFRTGLSQGILLSIYILGTYGLMAAYVLIGLVGLPTAYVLHRRSALNLYSMNVVALCWLLVMLSALWGISIYFGTAGPVESEVITLLKGFFFLAPSIMFSASVFTWVVTRSSPLQFGLQDMLLLVSIACASLAVASILRTAIEPRVVTRVTHPNGTRLLVTQEFGSIGEPFTTEIFFDQGDGKWRWYYYDHEDSYWGSASYEITGSQIDITSLGNRRILFDTATGDCRWTNASGRSRETDRSTRTEVEPPVPFS